MAYLCNFVFICVHILIGWSLCNTIFYAYFTHIAAYLHILCIFLAYFLHICAYDCMWLHIPGRPNPVRQQCTCLLDSCPGCCDESRKTSRPLVLPGLWLLSPCMRPASVQQHVTGICLNLHGVLCVSALRLSLPQRQANGSRALDRASARQQPGHSVLVPVASPVDASEGHGWKTLTVGHCLKVFSTIQGKTKARHFCNFSSESPQ